MILFQIEDINLFKRINSYNFKIQEDIIRYENESPYLEGGYRNYDNKSKKIKIEITGTVTSQHFLHWIRALAKRDSAKGEVKVFFLEKYTTYDYNYNPISTNTPNNEQIRLMFTYAHIDPDAINDFKMERYYNGTQEEYNVKFTIDLIYTNLYDITNSNNAYIYDNNAANRLKYDNGYKYDTGLKYDSFISSIQLDNLSLESNQAKLEKFYDQITCCGGDSDCVDDYRVYYIDNIIEPFYRTNRSIYRGTILNQDGTKFLYANNKKNFLQTFLPQVNASNVLVNSKILFLNEGIENTLNKVINVATLQKVTNTWTRNAIIQIYRLTKPTPTTFEASQLFTAVGQEITFKFSNGEINNSSLSIKYNKQSNDVENIKLLIFIPHKQKWYASYNTIPVVIDNEGFNFTNYNSSLVDIDFLFLSGKLTETSTYNDNHDSFRLTPTYTSELGDETIVDYLNLSATGFTLSATNNIIFQVYSLDENKPF